MNIDIKKIIIGLLESNGNRLFGKIYIIDDDCLLTFENDENDKYLIDLICLSECTGIEAQAERIMIFENGEIALLIDKDGYKFPDDAGMHKILNDLKVSFIKMGMWETYLKNKKKSYEQNMEEIREFNRQMKAKQSL